MNHVLKSSGEKPKEAMTKNHLLHANICQNRQRNGQAQRQSSNQGRREETAPVRSKTGQHLGKIPSADEKMGI